MLKICDYFTAFLCPFHWWLCGKESACQCRRCGFDLWSGEGNGNPLQYFYLENPMDRGDWLVQSMRSQRVGHDLVIEQQQPLLI